ncbi:sugar phosphate nucleotidyltransferase [Parabacteroides sp. Marseille-P3160]|uniref:sugar phosphate nucleotidyltransferase n=1 Tax=Parabacteroides sp. Marseille-P3160 TaxID=1917887 RepID=UPI0009BA699D|nr:sugar phosphate nucleotidyltransferase [Parabacteroides sp. Marseille-P3160]
MDYAIIAAGEGSRLIQEGVKRPKPLVRLNGVALIDRLIDLFLANDATSINVIVNEEMKEVQAHLNEKTVPVPFHLHIKSTPSSMHSFYELASYLKGDRFCLTTVDTVFKEEEFTSYIQSFISSKEDGLLAVTDFIDDEKPLYIDIDSEGFIRQFSDLPIEGSPYVSGGIYGLRRSALPILKQAIESGVSRMRNYQRLLIENGLKLKAYPFKKILDVDHAEDIEKAASFLRTET